MNQTLLNRNNEKSFIVLRIGSHRQFTEIEKEKRGHISRIMQTNEVYLFAR
jgi:hypothetical protein